MDRADVTSRRVIECIGRQLPNNELLGELVVVDRRDELLELLMGLLA